MEARQKMYMALLHHGSFSDAQLSLSLVSSLSHSQCKQAMKAGSARGWEQG